MLEVSATILMSAITVLIVCLTMESFQRLDRGAYFFAKFKKPKT